MEECTIINDYSKKRHFAMKRQKGIPHYGVQMSMGNGAWGKRGHLLRQLFPLKYLSYKTEMSVAYFFNWSS